MIIWSYKVYYSSNLSKVVSCVMATGVLQLCASSVRASLQRLTVGPNKIALLFQEGTDLIINCAKYGSNWKSFAIWARVTFFGTPLRCSQPA